MITKSRQPICPACLFDDAHGASEVALGLLRVDGDYQDAALALLGEPACHLGFSRGELTLALVDKGRHAPARTSTE